MQFLKIIRNTDLFKKIKKTYDCEKKAVVQGINDLQRAYLAAGLISENNGTSVVLFKNIAQYRVYNRIINELLPDVPVYELKFYDSIFDTVAENKNYEQLAERHRALLALENKQKSIVYVNMDGYSSKYPKPQQLYNCIKLEVGLEINIDKLMHNLVEYGYSRNDRVFDVGEFAVRGDILDIYPLNSLYAVRVELLGEVVDDIRYFDVLTQRSVENLNVIKVEPVVHLNASNDTSIFDYLEKTLVIANESQEMLAELKLKYNSLTESELAPYISYDLLCKQHNNLKLVDMCFTMDNDVEQQQVIKTQMLSNTPYHRKTELFIDDAKRLLAANNLVILAMSNVAKAKAVSKNMNSIIPMNLLLPNEPVQLSLSAVNCIVSNIADGFNLIEENITVFTEKDLFGISKQRRFAPPENTGKINYFTDIRLGDYVVHNIHGIGQYVGIDKIEVDGILKDYIIIKYAGNDKLYVLADQVIYLHKYIGNDGVAPKLSKMGGSEWNRLKSKAKLSITNMAQDLLRLYAQREISEGFAFPEDDVWQQEFEEAFEYEETADQLKATREIKLDMQKPRPMDRLLCGDVGYGKTEVAMRAAYKAVLAGKQVAVLVPTTILARQHLQTFNERMAGFGVRIQSLSRFNTNKEQQANLDDLANGKIDVIIGTHRLLQNDINFKNLGLLIIDEEQRFGVAQKEKIKKFAINVDTLTLSATPIPRTLHMTLLMAKDMSVIETAPENKMAVETYVLPESEELILKGIQKELKRGGRVYYVVRFIEHIDTVIKKLHRLIPEARIAIAHGRMPEGQLENSIADFYDGDCDILLSTTIVENGLDVPQANTIIIQDADQFGLSQLYQMRGRVGRGVHLSYAYLLHKPQKSISEIAQKRLDAIRSFTQLGAGFKIAMRDLEIRGAGSILGDRQHGHVLSIGFQAYCQLLEETIMELKGQKTDKKINFEPNIEIAYNMHIQSDYMPNNSDKLEIYKRLAIINSREDEHDFLDEIIDRFGTPPKDLVDMIKVAGIRGVCRTKGIKSIVAKGREISFIFADNAEIKPDNLMRLLLMYKKNAAMTNNTPIKLTIKVDKDGTDYVELLGKIMKILLPESF